MKSRNPNFSNLPTLTKIGLQKKVFELDVSNLRYKTGREYPLIVITHF